MKMTREEFKSGKWATVEEYAGLAHVRVEDVFEWARKREIPFKTWRGCVMIPLACLKCGKWRRG